MASTKVPRWACAPRHSLRRVWASPRRSVPPPPPSPASSSNGSSLRSGAAPACGIYRTRVTACSQALWRSPRGVRRWSRMVRSRSAVSPRQHTLPPPVSCDDSASTTRSTLLRCTEPTESWASSSWVSSPPKSSASPLTTAERGRRASSTVVAADSSPHKSAALSSSPCGSS